MDHTSHHGLLFIWDVDPHEHTAYLGAGFLEGWIEEHRESMRRRLQLPEGGTRVVLVRATVAEVLREVLRLGMTSTAASASLAIANIHLRRSQAGSDGDGQSPQRDV